MMEAGIASVVAALDEGLPYSQAGELLHEAAIARTGYRDFGETSYREGMSVLLDALDRTPPRTAAQRARAVQHMVDLLTGRLHAQAGWTQKPEALTRQIEVPLFIGGVPRSGTTALHKLMSMDPQFQGLERWLGRAPMPRPDRALWESLPAFQATLGEVKARADTAPNAQRAHRIAAEEVDECLAAMAQSFVSNWFGSNHEVPDYDRWFLEQDETASYRRYHDILRLVGVDDDRRWLLKNPSHILGIEGLLTAFPDACIVLTHRHPTETIASLANLMADILGASAEGRSAIARRNLEIWRIAVERTMAAQERQPDRFFDVDFRRFLADPMRVVRSIYDRFGVTLSAEAETRMMGWIAENPQNKHGVHSYTLEAGKLGRDEVRDAFAPYIRRYGLDD